MFGSSTTAQPVTGSSGWCLPLTSRTGRSSSGSRAAPRRSGGGRLDRRSTTSISPVSPLLPMRSRAWPLHLLLAGFVAVACIYMSFLEPWGHDTWFHLQRLQDVEQQLGRGQLRMHFAENAAQGKGIPVWVYYSQWVYLPALLPRSLGVSP